MRVSAIMLIPLLVLTLTFISSGCDEDTTPTSVSEPVGYTGEKVTFRVSHTKRLSSNTHIMWEYVDERLQYYTDGEVKLEIFPFGILFSVAEEFDACATGALDMVAMDAEAAAAGGLPDYLINHLPFFFGETAADAFDHDSRFLEHPDGGLQMLAQLDDYGIHGIGYLPSITATGIINNRGTELTSYYQSAGFKSMSAGGMSDLIVEEVGWVPVELDTAETPIAFEQGLIDAYPIAMESLVAYGYYEWIDSGIFSYPVATHSPLVLSLSTWNKLSPELQGIIENKLFPEVYDYTIENSPKEEAEAMQILEDAGFTIYWISHEERIQHRDGMLKLMDDKGYSLLFDLELVKLGDYLRTEPYDEGPYEGMYY